MKKSKTIVFFGSGPVAAASLRLLATAFTIEAVITKPRAAHHKGDVPVLDVAEEFALPVFTATNRKTLDDLFAKRPTHSEVAILIDFGIIVSQEVIDYFPLGIINSHFSLLPEWRGADPITFAILSGQQKTGVSLMLLVAGMDEGPLLAQESIPLDDHITTPVLTEQLIRLSYAMLETHVPRYIEGTILPYPQSNDGISYSRKLRKDDALVDWRKPAAQIEREIRAFISWPKTRTNFSGLDVVLTKARVIDEHGEPGTTKIIHKCPVVYCSESALLIEKIKPAGRQEMTGEAFLAGYKSFFLSAGL